MKKDLRKKYLALRDTFGDEEKRIADIKITEDFLSSDIFASAQSLFIYVSMGSETATGSIITAALDKRKLVAVPVVSKRQMGFYRICSLDGLRPSSFGVPEPEPTEANLRVCDKETLIAVPGLVFSRDGYRIGYGGGYYDRYLAENKPMLSVGLAYSFQVTDRLPSEAYDIPVNRLLTDAGWILTSPI